MNVPNFLSCLRILLTPLVMFLIGFFAALWVGGLKIYSLARGEEAILVTDSPYFYISLVTMILGTQLFLTGFLAEMISRNSRDRDKYHVEKTL